LTPVVFMSGAGPGESEQPRPADPGHPLPGWLEVLGAGDRKEKVQLHATHAAIALGKDQSAYPGLPAASATCIFNGEVTLAKGGRYRFSILDRKSTRLNSSHSQISYAVFCLKKKNHMASLCS